MVPSAGPPRVARFERDLKRFVITDAKGSRLTKEGRRVLRERFRKLVVYDPVPARGNDAVMLAWEKRVEERAENRQSRFANWARLPNALLFGGDNLGPDLTQAFAAELRPGPARDEYLDTAKYQNEMFARSGRNTNWGDQEVAVANGMTGDFVVNANLPGKVQPYDLVNRRLTSFLIYFEPTHYLNSNAYRGPTPEEVHSIQLAGTQPLELR